MTPQQQQLFDVLTINPICPLEASYRTKEIPYKEAQRMLDRMAETDVIVRIYDREKPVYRLIIPRKPGMRTNKEVCHH